ncbi:MAG TPA: hypothetical protein P5291_07830, partial [Flavobacteriales bacterium]|nr:hypothetical protein [Flavobacteriales bacterium]
MEPRSLQWTGLCVSCCHELLGYERAVRIDLRHSTSCAAPDPGPLYHFLMGGKQTTDDTYILKGTFTPN